ncbi:MAG TPA: carboxypeptidase-like regulatory domain-containing protein [Pyrinomonadaceae bacterium]|jgi:hypothetical protein|nr:carboxypeptidase-like regulatory domain-containing protein [Pyrinomonadaceae bacterium]
MKILSDGNGSAPVSFVLQLAVVALFVSTVCVQIDAQEVRQTPPAAPARPLGQSVITGRVVFEENGQPVANVRVQLVSVRRAEAGPQMVPMFAMANDQGEFRFNGVAAGQYSVIAQLDPRSITNNPPSGDANVNQPRSAATIISVDGRTNAQVEVRVPNLHFGIISGYVLRAGGDIAVNSRVTCASTNSNTRFAMSVTTDDKGAFRFERVPAGEYLLSAGAPAPRSADGPIATQLASFSFVQTYYPSTPDQASAMPITVAADGETPGINITLIERSLHRVSGTLRFRSGEPIPRVAVQLIPKTDAAPVPDDPLTLSARVPHVQSTADDGSWSFSNVPDGEYFLKVDPRQMAPPRNSANDPAQPRPPTPKFTAKQLSVSVAGFDLNDVPIEVSAGARISGLVVVEGDRPLPANISITAGAVKSTESRPATTTIQADGSFSLTGVPEGDVWITPGLRPANTFYVKAIDANGIDLTRSPLKVEEGAEIKNVRVVISSGVGILTGRVLSANGNAPLARIPVLLIPVDPEKQRFSGAQFTGLSQMDGSYLIGAAPGDYIVMTLIRGEQPPRLDPESLAQNKLRISLKPGERKNFDIVK